MYNHEYFRDAILIITVFFFIGITAGYVGLSFFSELSEVIATMYEGLEITGDPNESTFLYGASVFYNNAQSCVIAFLGGVAFSVVPIGIILLNGFFFGASIKLLSHQGSIFFLPLIPHFFFEIPALILSAALGLMLGQKVIYNRILHRTEEPIFLKELTKTFIFYIIPMLLIAAFLEAYLSTYLLSIIR
ncbi:MAG: stage II sporulation protein M [Methanospirillaceae archaeon]|nr:stage II sporulation protein M [Methanospirillaceae archaeon]